MEESKVNFIGHFLGFTEKAATQKELRSTDMAIYFALFSIWNRAYWHNPISINRNEVMLLSKVGGNATYSQSLRRLEKAGFIKYEPSNNPLKGSLVYMFIFSTSSEQLENTPKTYKKPHADTYTNPKNEKNNKKSENNLPQKNYLNLPNLKLEVIAFAKDSFDGKQFWNWININKLDPNDFKKHYKNYEAYGRKI